MYKSTPLNFSSFFLCVDNTMLWTVLGTVASTFIGILVGGMTVAAVELIGHKVFPVLPCDQDFNSMSKEQRSKLFKTIPASALLFVLAAYVLGPISGSAVASKLAPVGISQAIAASIVGAMLFAATIYNLTSLKHPLWFNICATIVMLPSMYVGFTLAQAFI